MTRQFYDWYTLCVCVCVCVCVCAHACVGSEEFPGGEHSTLNRKAGKIRHLSNLVSALCISLFGTLPHLDPEGIQPKTDDNVPI